MVDAKALLEGIRQDLQTVTEQLLHHPYVQALEEGKIGRWEKLRLFAGEQYSIIASDLKSVAYLLSRFGSAPSRCARPTRSSTVRARPTGRRSRLYLLHGVACALWL
jgi:hypothetical protein